MFIDHVLEHEHHQRLHSAMKWEDIERTTEIITPHKKHDGLMSETLNRHEYILLELLRLENVQESELKRISDKFSLLDEDDTGHVRVETLLKDSLGALSAPPVGMRGSDEEGSESDLGRSRVDTFGISGGESFDIELRPTHVGTL
jgi:hypothetical protein